MPWFIVYEILTLSMLNFIAVLLKITVTFAEFSQVYESKALNDAGWQHFMKGSGSDHYTVLILFALLWLSYCELSCIFVYIYVFDPKLPLFGFFQLTRRPLVLYRRTRNASYVKDIWTVYLIFLIINFGAQIVMWIRSKISQRPNYRTLLISTS